jgi:hypothetical protein
MDVFLHIPRTAGQSLSQLVLQNYAGDRILFTGDSAQEVQRLSLLTRTDYDACMGHIPWGVFTELQMPVNYVTFLRHPIDRHISEFYFHKNTEGSYHYQNIRAGLSLPEWFQIGRLRGNEIMDNTICRYISGTYVWADLDRRRAARAKDALCRMPAFGLTERFEESALLIGRALGLSHIFCVPTNSKRQPGSQMKFELAANDDLFAYDLELYKFAVDLFDDRIQRYGSVFGEALAAYREVAQQLRGQFMSYGGETHGYAQPPDVIDQLKAVQLPEPVKAFYQRTRQF